MLIPISKTYFQALLLAAGCALLASDASSQSNARSRIIYPGKDTLVLDTLSIIPGTVSANWLIGGFIHPDFYGVDYIHARVWWKDAVHNERNDSIVITYKVFPYLFSQSYQHKDISRIQNNRVGEPYSYSYDKTKDADLFKMEGLARSGSISRGISFGNNQDVVLNSSLNLQLTGKLNENMDLLLAATDQNIPIQPEGNTQQLQEFDKVFIQLGIKDLPENGKTTLTAGDFQIAKPNGYFMSFNKKLQGLSIGNEWQKCYSGYNGVNACRKVASVASAAVSKGKFAKNSTLESANGNSFNGQKQERNQGPYKLRGAENEQFIIVLAGTEAVYLDGRILERGQENDYTVNYNTAEIVFTPKNLITKDTRLAVEFQYSDKNYARSLVHSGAAFENKKLKARINFYSEQDNKTKPLQQELSDSQKLHLATIGDSLHAAVWPSADSVAFNGSEVLYEKKDSMAGSYTFPIYVHSSDSLKAHYRLSFSFVGANKGNYTLKQSAANGKVYQWLLPDTLTNAPRGSYEPVVLLLTPKQKQMVTAGADLILGKNSRVSVEVAGSRNNNNTFSSVNKSNDDGFAARFLFDNRTPFSRASIQAENDSLGKVNTWGLVTNLNYEMVQKTFSSIERFRDVEFDRDWNRGNSLQSHDQHIFGGRIGAAKKENIILYDYKSLLEGGFYSGMKHAVNVRLGHKGFLLAGEGSFLDSKATLNNTNFLRHRAALSKKFILPSSGLLNIGLREQQERNQVMLKQTDSLMMGSAEFFEWEPFAEFKDSLNNRYGINYKQRTDYALKTPLGGAPELSKATFAENFGGTMDLASNPASRLRVNASYRRLTISDTAITTQKKENTVVGRAEYDFSILKDVFSSSTFYEVGSGLEIKREFLFLEVAQGKGTHIWEDYNANNIKELNEFELSPFQNEANYIKVWTPTDDYISTYTNQFSEVFSVKPAAAWGGKKGWKGFIARLSNQTAYRTDKKTTNADLAVAYNPFLSDAKDKTLITLNSSLRNTVYFNQTDPVFGLDHTFQDVRNKTLLENDTTARQNVYNETRLRWNVNSRWTFQTQYKQGTRRNKSEFFPSRNHRIAYFESEPRISYQPGAAFRMSVSYKYSEKKNTLVIALLPQAKAVSQNFGGEIRYNAVNKGSLTAKFNFILIEYNETENTPLAFEMLEGLKTGKNYTWNIGYSQTLASNIQLTLSYEGRQSPGIKAIHTGSAQVRAFF